MLAFDSISRLADTKIFDLQCQRKKRKEKMGSRNLREEKGRERKTKTWRWRIIFKHTTEDDCSTWKKLRRYSFGERINNETNGVNNTRCKLREKEEDKGSKRRFVGDWSNMAEEGGKKRRFRAVNDLKAVIHISEEMLWMLFRMQTWFVRAIAILDAPRPTLDSRIRGTGSMVRAGMARTRY